MTGLNTDFRKVQDGLRTTVSIAPHEQERLETFLELQREERLIRYGISVQDSALLTCYAPSVMEDGHFHFPRRCRRGLLGGGLGHAGLTGRLRYHSVSIARPLHLTS